MLWFSNSKAVIVPSFPYGSPAHLHCCRQNTTFFCKLEIEQESLESAALSQNLYGSKKDCLWDYAWSHDFPVTLMLFKLYLNVFLVLDRELKGCLGHEGGKTYGCQVVN